MNIQSPSHAEWEELAALAALGAIEPADRQRLEEHLANCAECRQAFDDYRLVAAGLDRSVPAAVAPPALEGRLLAQARAGQPRRGGWRRLAAAAAVLALLLVGGWLLSPSGGAAPALTEQALRSIDEILPDANSRLIALAGAREGPHGLFIWTPDQPVATMSISGLPTRAGRRYYLWLIRKDGGGDHIGVYESNASGTIQTGVEAPRPWSSYQQIIITDNQSHEYHEQPASGILMGDFQ